MLGLNISIDEIFFLRDVFALRVSTQPEVIQALSKLACNTGWMLEECFVPVFAKEIQNSSKVINLTEDNILDNAIMERLNMMKNGQLKYLYYSFERLHEIASKNFMQTEKGHKLLEIAAEVVTIIPSKIQLNKCILLRIQKKMIKNYSVTSLENPEIFEQFEETTASKIEFQSKTILETFANGFNIDFLDNLFQNVENRELLSQFILNKLLTERVTQNANNLEILIGFLELPLFLENFFTLKERPFIPGPKGIHLTDGINDVNGEMIESLSCLGCLIQYPYFKRQVLSIKDFEAYSMSIKKFCEELKSHKTKSAYEGFSKSVNEKMTAARKPLAAIITKFIRKPRIQPEIFRFLWACIKGNTDRLKLGNRFGNKNSKSSSQSFNMCLTDIMLDLVNPIISKPELLKKIDPTYLLVNPYIKKVVDVFFNQSSQEDNSKKMQIEFGTTTEIFFLTLEVLHVCFITYFEEFEDQINSRNRLESELNKMLPSNPKYNETKKLLEFYEDLVFSNQFLLMSASKYQSITNYYNVLIELIFFWLKIEKSEFKNGENPGYSLPDISKGIPEHIINDIATLTTNSVRIFYKIEQVLDFKHVNFIIDFLTLLICNIKLTNNIHIVATLYEAIFYLILTLKGNGVQKLFLKNDFCKNNFIPGTIRFFIEIEFTGQRGGFYTKYQYRQGVTKILLSILHDPSYRTQFRETLATQNGERFVALLLNDLNYFMDEGFQKLPEIKKYTENKDKISEEEKATLKQYRDICKSCFNQGNDALNLLAEVAATSNKVLSFEIISKKVANIANYYIQKLSREHFMRIKFQEYEKLNLKPLFLITQILKIFSYLNEDDLFIQNIIKDERSFSLTALDEAAGHELKKNLLSLEERENFQKFYSKVTMEASEKNNLAELIGDDYPEEFKCAITFDLMNDPVKLPTSNVVCDRNSIKEHLLNDEKDPFNRKPLKYNELIPMPDIKEKIRVFIQKKIDAANEKKKKEKENDDMFNNEAPVNSENPLDWGGYRAPTAQKSFLYLQRQKKRIPFLLILLCVSVVIYQFQWRKKNAIIKISNNFQSTQLECFFFYIIKVQSFIFHQKKLISQFLDVLQFQVFILIRHSSVQLRTIIHKQLMIKKK